MNIRFQGNFQVFGPKRETVRAELESFDATSSKLGIGVVSRLSCNGRTCNPNQKFGGFLLTDEDAVHFLTSKGMPLPDLNRDKADIQKEADTFVAQRFKTHEPEGMDEYAQEVALYSYKLRFIDSKYEEKHLIQ